MGSGCVRLARAGGESHVITRFLRVWSPSQLIGLASFIYSKCVEQGTIREGAAAVKKVIDEEINVKYENVRQDARNLRARRARCCAPPPHPLPLPRSAAPEQDQVHDWRARARV